MRSPAWRPTSRRCAPRPATGATSISFWCEMAATRGRGRQNQHFAPSGPPRESLERGRSRTPAPRSGEPGGRATGLRLGDLGQVVGEHAPADPAAHPVLPVIPAAVQLKAAAQYTDPALDARPEPKAAPPPTGPLLLPTGG